MDISHPIDAAKNKDNIMNDLTSYFIKQYKIQKEKKRKRKSNCIEMDKYFTRLNGKKRDKVFNRKYESQN